MLTAAFAFLFALYRATEEDKLTGAALLALYYLLLPALLIAAYARTRKARRFPNDEDAAE